MVVTLNGQGQLYIRDEEVARGNFVTRLAQFVPARVTPLFTSGLTERLPMAMSWKFWAA